jgi:cardiolipin synthase (CMP-forming)
MRSKLPNIITSFRVLSSFFITLYYFLKLPFYNEVVFFIFVLSSISDFFDGYLSRKWNVVSKFGQCLDPISDKLLTITALIILVDAKGINLIFSFLIIAREIVISGLREFLSLQSITLPVSKLSKWKTGFQLTGLSMCFFAQSKHFPVLTEKYITFFPPFKFFVQNIQIISFYVTLVAVILTVYTAAQYISKSIHHL